MSDQNPMDKIANLAHRLKDAAASLGLDMQDAHPQIDMSGRGHHMMVAVFNVDLPDADTAEADDLDRQLAGIMAATEKQEAANLQRQIEDDKAAEARDKLLRLRERLAEGKGLLDDD